MIITSYPIHVSVVMFVDPVLYSVIYIKPVESVHRLERVGLRTELSLKSRWKPRSVMERRR